MHTNIVYDLYMIYICLQDIHVRLAHKLVHPFRIAWRTSMDLGDSSAPAARRSARDARRKGLLLVLNLSIEETDFRPISSHF